MAKTMVTCGSHEKLYTNGSSGIYLFVSFVRRFSSTRPGVLDLVRALFPCTYGVHRASSLG